MLNEIDARTVCFEEGNTYIGMCSSTNKGITRFMMKVGRHTVVVPLTGKFKYTRSRDALKDIRPEGWTPTKLMGNVINKLWSFGLYHWPSNTSTVQTSLPTEELAELHAIIQAIDYERSQNVPNN